MHKNKCINVIIDYKTGTLSIDMNNMGYLFFSVV